MSTVGKILKICLKTVDFFLTLLYNIKAVCRDGGAVERARFEIVLCRNVYKGSNPFLCAKITDRQNACPFLFVNQTRKGVTGLLAVMLAL